MSGGVNDISTESRGLSSERAMINIQREKVESARDKGRVLNLRPREKGQVLLGQKGEGEKK